MSKFIEYKTVYMDETAAMKAFPNVDPPKPGFYVFHPRKPTMGPYVDKSHALEYIKVEICHDLDLEKEATEK